jgi:hypothetical protein
LKAGGPLRVTSTESSRVESSLGCPFASPTRITQYSHSDIYYWTKVYQVRSSAEVPFIMWSKIPLNIFFQDLG